MADDDDYVQSLADASGATVIASDAPVEYSIRWFDDDFRSQGAWETFAPAGETPSGSPAGLGLDTVSPPSGGGGKAGTEEEPVANMQQFDDPAPAPEQAAQIDFVLAQDAISAPGRSSVADDDDAVRSVAEVESGTLIATDVPVQEDLESFADDFESHGVLTPADNEAPVSTADVILDTVLQTGGIGPEMVDSL